MRTVSERLQLTAAARRADATKVSRRFLRMTLSSMFVETPARCNRVELGWVSHGHETPPGLPELARRTAAAVGRRSGGRLSQKSCQNHFTPQSISESFGSSSQGWEPVGQWRRARRDRRFVAQDRPIDSAQRSAGRAVIGFVDGWLDVARSVFTQVSPRSRNCPCRLRRPAAGAHQPRAEAPRSVLIGYSAGASGGTCMALQLQADD